MFKGRIGRFFFAFAVVGLLIAGTAVNVVVALLSGIGVPEFWLYAALFLWAALSLLVAMSFTVRRWHDLGRSGWWALLSLVPIVNLFCLFILLFWPGQSARERVSHRSSDGPHFDKSFDRSIDDRDFGYDPD